MPSAIQLDPALLAAGAWLWTGTAWVKCSGDSTGRLRVDLAASEITLNTYTYPTAGVHNVSVQNFPGNQGVTPYPNNWSVWFGVSGGLVKSGAVYLHSIVHANTQTAGRYIIIHNGASAAAVRILVIQNPAQDTRSMFFFPALYCSAGIYVEVQEAAYANVTILYY